MKEPFALVGSIALLGFVAHRLAALSQGSRDTGWGPEVGKRLLALLVCWLILSALLAGRRGPRFCAAERQWLGAHGVSLVDLLTFRAVGQLPGTLASSVLIALTVEATSISLLAQRIVGLVVLLTLLSFATGFLQTTKRLSVGLRNTLVLLVAGALLLEVAGDLLVAVQFAPAGAPIAPAWSGEGAALDMATVMWLPASLLSVGVGASDHRLLLGGQLAYAIAGLRLWSLATEEGGDWAFVDERNLASTIDSLVVRSAIRVLQPVVVIAAMTAGRRAVPLATKNIRVFCRSQPLVPIVLAVMGIPATTFLHRIDGMAGSLEFVLGLVSVFGLYLLLAGPLLIRADIRVSIPAISHVRLVALPSWRVVAAENIPSVVVLTSAQVVFLSVMLSSVRELLPFSGFEGGALAFSCVVYLVAFNVSNVSFHAVLAFAVSALTKVGPWAPENRSELTRNHVALLCSVIAGTVLLAGPMFLAGVILQLIGADWPDPGSSRQVASTVLLSAFLQLAVSAVLVRLAARLMEQSEPRRST